MRYLGFVLLGILLIASCGGKVLTPQCKNDGTACRVPGSTVDEPIERAWYCCPDDTYTCCHMGSQYGCCGAGVTSSYTPGIPLEAPGER